MVYYIDTYTETIMFDRLEDALFFFLPRRCSLCRPQCPNQKMGKVEKVSTPQAAGPSHGSLSPQCLDALITEKAAVKQRENLLRKINPQMSRERQVILYSCQEITQPLPITPVICGRPITATRVSNGHTTPTGTSKLAQLAHSR